MKGFNEKLNYTWGIVQKVMLPAAEETGQNSELFPGNCWVKGDSHFMD